MPLGIYEMCVVINQHTYIATKRLLVVFFRVRVLLFDENSRTR